LIWKSVLPYSQASVDSGFTRYKKESWFEIVTRLIANIKKLKLYLSSVLASSYRLLSHGWTTLKSYIGEKNKQNKKTNRSKR
jgi:hypothetical protein